MAHILTWLVSSSCAELTLDKILSVGPEAGSDRAEEGVSKMQEMLPCWGRLDVAAQ